MTMKASFCLVWLGTVIALSGCDRLETNEPIVETEEAQSFDAVLLQLSAESNLPLFDLSIPFDRLDEAPAGLKELASLLAEGVPGNFVMRYSDDTLKHVYHVFQNDGSGIRYITISSTAGNDATREEIDVSAIQYDELTSTLTLESPSGRIQLTPTDVTPVGA